MAVLAHDGDELPDVEGIIAVRAEQEFPALGTEFGGAKLDGLHGYMRELAPPLFDFCRWR